MAYYSKYSGKEVDERLDRVDSIPTKISQLLNDKDYITEIELKAILDKISIVDFSKIPIDEDTIYWSENSDGKLVLKSKGGVSNWSVREDSNGNKYIYTELPVVTQYGITMYSGDGVNVPSLASGLPFDGRTIWYNPETQQIEVIGGTGGGSGEGVSNFWDLSGIPSWITNSKPKYTYSEIEGTPDLSGFATQNWIISQGYALAEELKKYIPISGYTEVSGEKNFTGGLKVNGSPIYYDTEKKYWKLEGDLLVTGGVTMYGSDSSFTPSTIMDAILYDDATLGINSNGELYVKGSISGSTTLGSLSNVGTWADSVADVDRIMYQAAGSSSWVAKSLSSIGGTGGGGLDITALQNYLTQNSYLNVTEGDNRYLKLSGGTISSTGNTPLGVTSQNGSWVGIEFTNKDSKGGAIGVNNSSPCFVLKDRSAVYTLLHSNNIGSYAWTSSNDGEGSGLDADLLDGKQPSELNVASATKLQTARTIWGQSFDGTGNVNGNITMTSGSTIQLDGKRDMISFSKDFFVLGYDNCAYGVSTYLDGYDIRFRTGSSWSTSMLIDGYSNVGIGTTSPSTKLEVKYSGISPVKIVSTSSTESSIIYKYGSEKNWVAGAYKDTFFIYSEKAGAQRFYVDSSGNGLFHGGVTMYSDQRKKTILNHVELSLKQIANAPLIEHYYNSDDKKTTHVGSIAQYWASMNDWFCKLDSEGYYTMEIQNAALASAISIARELDRYETKTDKAIKKLKKRICELEEEVERLKAS